MGMSLRAFLGLLVVCGIAAGLLLLDRAERHERPGPPPAEAPSPPLEISSPVPVPPVPAPQTRPETAEAPPEPPRPELTPEETERRAEKAAIAQKLPPEEAVPHLVRMLGSPELTRRRTAVVRLTDIGPEAAPAVPALLEALEIEELRLRVFAARALGEIGPAAHDAIGALEACLGSDDEGFRAAVARAIWRITGVSGPAVTVMNDILDTGPRLSPQFAAWSLGSMGADGAGGVPALIDRLNRETTPVVDRTQIYFGLARIGVGAMAALPHARRDLGAESLKLRSAAAYAVFKLSGDAESTLPILIEAIEKGDRNVSTWAAGNIGDLGAVAAPAVDALRKARDEGIDKIRGPAALSLYRITGDPGEALPLLVEVLRGQKPGSDEYAKLLGEMGRDARPAIPVLEAATKAPNYRLRREAVKALDRIRDG